jgi:hypothetical protein
MGYYYTTRWAEKTPAVDNAAGQIILPMGVASDTLERRHIRTAAPLLQGLQGGNRERLLDPQIYLAGLDADTCPDVCTNLVTYPWFKRTAPQRYDSGQLTQRAYVNRVRATVGDLWQGLPATTEEAAVREAIDFQVQLDCDYLILPSPLAIDLGTQYATELEWLDQGLAAAAELAPGRPTLATVALCDTCTFSVPPKDNPLIELVLDHVAAREASGVYLVVEQKVDKDYYLTSGRTIETLLRLVADFKAAGLQRVIVAWCGTAGLLATTAGADGWVSGWYRSERRLKLDGLAEDGGGLPTPAFYSHRLGGELHPKDLDQLRLAGRLDLVDDQTPASGPLFRALRAGQTMGEVLQVLWTVHTARAHFNQVAIRESAALDALGGSGRIAHTRAWLRSAVECAKAVKEACQDPLHDRTSVTHQSTWLKAFEAWGHPDL